MQRTIRPELLDSLPPQHPDALHNRRDLRVTNGVMGNHRWFERALPPLLRSGERALELGAGTGELGARLARRGLQVDGLDLWPRPTEWPAGRRWHQADLLAFDAFDDYHAIVGNLIFHQFTAAELAELGARMSSTVRVIVACEPVRRRFSQFLYRVFGPALGVNRVSLHDAHVSIAAGFQDDELAVELGLDPRQWNVRVDVTLLGAYRLIAVREK